MIFTLSFFNVSSSPLGLGKLCKLHCDFRGIYHRVWGCIRSCGLSCAASYITFTASQSVGRVKICFILKKLIDFNCCLVCFSCHHSCLLSVEARLQRHSLSRELSWVCAVRRASARSGLGPASTLQSLNWRDQFRLSCLLRLDPPRERGAQTPGESRCSGPAPDVPVLSNDSALLSRLINLEMLSSLCPWILPALW